MLLYLYPMNIKIRKATKGDMFQVHQLVHELAIFEHAPDQVTTTPQQYMKDGFEQKLFEVIVAEDTELPVGEKIVGMAFYFHAYSTWKGRFIWLDDLVVTANYRHTGVGSLLFKQVIANAKSIGMPLVKWQVLDWNLPAIKFYNKMNALHDKDWLTYKLNAGQYDDVLNS